MATTFRCERLRVLEIGGKRLKSLRSLEAVSSGMVWCQ